MTAHHDPDRIIRAWLDQMPDEAPYRTVAAVLQAVEVTPQQRRGFHGRWRFPTMSRFAIIAAAAAVAVAVGGVALLASRPSPDAVPIGAPSASPASLAPAATPAPTPSPAPTPAIAPLDGALRSEWLADVATVDGVAEHDPRVRLVVGSGGRTVALQTNKFGNTTLSSSPVEATPTELRLVTDEAGAGCEVGDEGTYRWTLSDDGLLLELEPITDVCAARASAFGRTWTRSLDAHSPGGRGVISAFDPGVLVTLPDQPFGGQTTADSAEIGSVVANAALYVVKNPWGLAEPCVAESSTTVPLESGVDPFIAYLRTLPGADVATDELAIGGHRAAHVDLTIDPAAECSASAMDAWTAKNVTSGWRWGIALGDSASLYVVELPDATYVLQYFGESVTPADEAAVMSTVVFVDALPPSP